MSLVAPVENGKITESASTTSVSKAKSTADQYSQDTFLKLLVAEVQNQDPLEPSSNTEWVSQYATFSELETMQSMSASYDLSRASALVGKIAIMKVTGSNGDTNLVQGKVDYVTYDSGKALLNINGNAYSIDDLYNVVDETYLNAYDAAYEWTVSMNKLPSIGNVTLDDKDKITALYEQYEEMDDYQKSFIATDSVTKIKEYRNRINELLKEQTASEETPAVDETENAENTGNAGETETAEETGNTEETVKTDDEETVDSADETEISETVAESGSVESTEETNETNDTGEGVSGEDETTE